MKKPVFASALVFAFVLFFHQAQAQRVAHHYTKLSIEEVESKRNAEYLAIDFDVQLVDCLNYVKFHFVKNGKQQTELVRLSREDYYMENGMIMCHARLVDVKEFSGLLGRKDAVDNLSYEVVSKTGRVVHRDNLSAYYKMLYDSGSFPLTRK